MDDLEELFVLNEGRPLPRDLLAKGERLRWAKGEHVPTRGGVYYVETGLIIVRRILLEGQSKALFVARDGHFFHDVAYAQQKQGLTEVLEKQGFSYTIVPRGTDDTYRSVIEKTVYPGSGTAVVAALDFASTAEAAEIVGGSSVYGKYISGLYGVGMMPSLLDQLDKGTIRGLVVTNQFDAGYFAVQKAVQAIEKEQERSQLSLESYYIEKDELRSKKYEKMLYPID